MIVEPLRYETVRYVADRMRPADVEEIFALRFSDDREAFTQEILTHGAMAWVVGLQEPIAVLGLDELWPGVWEGWMFATTSFDKIGQRLTRFTYRAIVPGLAKLGCRRIQAHSMEGHSVAHHWMKTLGAVREAELKGFGKNGEDFVVFRLSAGDMAAARGRLSLVPILEGS